MEDLAKYQQERINALLAEIARLNEALTKYRYLAFKTRLSDPNFDKPLSEVETNFEIIEA
jgi:hypothetical protein